MKIVAILFLSLALIACRAEQSASQTAGSTVTDSGVVLSPHDTPPPLKSDAFKLDAQKLEAGAIAEAYAAHRNLPQVSGYGLVEKVLKDDTKGSQHQKFLLRVSDNITVLVAHNIDLAPRIKDITEGDTVEFSGEYIYTPKGGTIHWTHRDPRGNRKGGWLKHNGNTYE